MSRAQPSWVVIPGIPSTREHKEDMYGYIEKPKHKTQAKDVGAGTNHRY